ncbi:MAG: hypothetical protein PHY09_00895 [Desulfuromonadaceae bacterium]|nr:hypothetical protein [Desulfuromonadaceae bacterium]MDD5104873.1 hypothetical protein [Desulfuromonadaceae bacterium]
MADIKKTSGDLICIEQSLNGLSMLLEDISNKSQIQAGEVSYCKSILQLIIKQVEETADALLLVN